MTRPSPLAAGGALRDTGLHLFVDDEGIYQCYGVRRELGRPHRLPQPVLRGDGWETGRIPQMWGSVLYDTRRHRFRGWYLSCAVDGRDALPPEQRQVFCYAESDDGIAWHKPSLDRFEVAGSRANNVCFMLDPAVDGLNGCDGGTVVYDPDDPNPAARYKLVTYLLDDRMYTGYGTDAAAYRQNRKRYGASAGHYLLTSPDGIDWSRPGKPPGGRLSAMLEHGLRDANKLWRDEVTGEWVWSVGPRSDGTASLPDGRVRLAGVTRSRDLVHWSAIETPLVLDEDDLWGRAAQFHFPGYLFAYGDQYLGFLDCITDFGKRFAVYLLSSRDGRRWERVLRREALIPGGPPGAWDHDLPELARPPYPDTPHDWEWPHLTVTVDSAHSAPIAAGDELYVYYTARDYRDRRRPIGGVGLARFRRDGFAGLRSVAHAHGDAPAFVLTRPVEVTGPELTLNLRLDSPAGWARVQVRDGSLRTPDLAPLPGYTLAECDPIAAGGVRLPVRWHDHPDLSDLVGRTVMLYIQFSDATLYAYRFTPT